MSIGQVVPVMLDECSSASIRAGSPGRASRSRDAIQTSVPSVLSSVTLVTVSTHAPHLGPEKRRPLFLPGRPNKGWPIGPAIACDRRNLELDACRDPSLSLTVAHAGCFSSSLKPLRSWTSRSTSHVVKRATSSELYPHPDCPELRIVGVVRERVPKV